MEHYHRRMATWKDAVRRVLYPAYEARVVKHLPPDRIPRHVGVMLDGNRRWAREKGAGTAEGHRAGADNIEPFLQWSEDLGIDGLEFELVVIFGRLRGHGETNCAVIGKQTTKTQRH